MPAAMHHEHWGRRAAVSTKIKIVREVGALAQDLVDPPAAQPARAELEEDADAVGVGALDHGGEVEGADRLAVQGLLGARRGRGVGGGGGGGVEARPGDRGGRAELESALWIELAALAARDGRTDAAQRHVVRALACAEDRFYVNALVRRRAELARWADPEPS